MFKVNEYFEGKVKSIAFTTAEGAATAGVMAAGSYEFGTAAKEIMMITTGKVKVLLPGTTEWKEVCGGENFEVPANSKFGINVLEETSYVCLYR